MTSLFQQLASEKKNNIINAALNAFAKNGYEKASTNNIVQAASISKGSLYNYFGTKKGLYVYLVEMSAEIIEKIYDLVDLEETDIFVKIEAIGLAKLNIQREYPSVFDFLYSMAKEEAAAVVEMNQAKIQEIYSDGFQKIYENVDYNLFKEGVNPEKAIEILNWTMTGFGERAIATVEFTDELHDDYLKEWTEYSSILRQAFYK